MRVREWLDGVFWIPVWVLVGGTIAVSVFKGVTPRRLRMIGTTTGAVLSVAGATAITVFGLSAPFLAVLVVWAAFLAVVVARAAAETPRLKFVLAGIVLAAPLALSVVAILASGTP